MAGLLIYQKKFTFKKNKRNERIWKHCLGSGREFRNDRADAIPSRMPPLSLRGGLRPDLPDAGKRFRDARRRVAKDGFLGMTMVHNVASDIMETAANATNGGTSSSSNVSSTGLVDESSSCRLRRRCTGPFTSVSATTFSAPRLEQTRGYRPTMMRAPIICSLR